MTTVPSSSMLISTPKYFCISWIVSPPLPMTIPIFSGLIFIEMRAGACLETSERGLSIDLSMPWRINSRAPFACSNTSRTMASVRPSIFVSIWSAVIPLRVPATLKSISPRKSSWAWISERTTYLPVASSKTIPIATPETGAVIGTPASMRASVDPQTEPIELEPLQVWTSETTRTV